jgi:hypothetical protein
VYVELLCDGHVLVRPPRATLTAAEREWLDDVARPELHAEWIVHERLECSRRTQRQAERRAHDKRMRRRGEPSVADPALVEALYPPEGPFGPR